MAPPEVCVVGEINPDLILYGLPAELKPEQETLIDGIRVTLGSSSAIFAHNLAALGTRTGIVAKIGDDPFGKMSLGWLGEAGVDTSHVVTTTDAPTGATVILAHPGYRYILTHPGAMFELSYADLDLDYVLSARHLHVSSYFLHRDLRPRLVELFRLAKERGLSTSLDTNDDPSGEWSEDLHALLPQVDIFFPNEREAKNIARAADLDEAIRFLARHCRLFVLKRGCQGALARQGNQEWRCAGTRVETKDAVGAGDSFDAGFLHRYLQGAKIEECLAYANVAGAYSTTREGGIEAFRRREQMREFFKARLPGA